MDERIKQGLAAGRVAFRTGKHDAAIVTWKEALGVAYETQNQSAAFVLSKNLGDAMLVQGDQVQQAIGYFDYALQLLEGCGLQHTYVFYPPLENVVQYIRRRRRRARRLVETLRHRTVNVQPTSPSINEAFEASLDEEKDAPETAGFCTTCEQPESAENPIVVDETDGFPYCRSCFDEFYAHADQEVLSADMNGGLEPLSTQDELSVDDDDAKVRENHLHSQSRTEEAAVQWASSEPSTSPKEVDTPSGDIAFAVTSSSPQQEETTSSDTLTDASRRNRNALVYTIEQLHSLRTFDQHCPNEIQASVVSVSSSIKSMTRSHATTTSDKTCLVPSLAECQTMRLSSMPSPFDMAMSLFETVPENPGRIPMSFQTQLNIFSHNG